MRFASLLLSFLFAAFTISAQVNPQCPVIRVEGPAVPQHDQLNSYSVTVKPTESRLTYKWSVGSGTIVNGQGTPLIGVRYGRDDLDASAKVEIGGLPQECPNIASDSTSFETGPQIRKLDTFSLPLKSVSEERLKAIAESLNNDPTAQLYIFLPAYKPGRDAILASLDSKGIDPTRITIVETSPADKMIEAWLVPPGAVAPSKCEACEKEAIKPKCPTISIVGPPGLTFAGNKMTFTVEKPEDFRGSYKWTVDHGNIENGQGSPSIEVCSPEVRDSVNVTATVELVGLPGKCVNKASETAGVYREYVPYATDTYGRLPINDEKARLSYAFEQLRKEKQGFVALIKIVVPTAGKISYESRVQTIKSLLTSLREDIDKAVFVNSGTGELSTTIYLIPQSAVPSFSKQ